MFAAYYRALGRQFIIVRMSMLSAVQMKARFRSELGILR